MIGHSLTVTTQIAVPGLGIVVQPFPIGLECSNQIKNCHP